MDDAADLSVLDGYAAWAPLYDDDGNPLIAVEGPAIQGWFGPLEGQRVLDLGCGTGRHTQSLVEAGAIVHALDGCTEMLARASHKLQAHGVGFVLHRLPDPVPFADSTFDLIVLGLVAEHINDLAAVLSEASRVAKPDARCLLSALHPDRTASGQRARFIDPSTGQRRHIATIHRSAEEYIAIAGSAGWSLVDARSLIVPPELAREMPRALPYAGLPLGWAACWRKA
jgi:SAM-dependent methyltransferase